MFMKNYRFSLKEKIIGNVTLLLLTLVARSYVAATGAGDELPDSMLSVLYKTIDGQTGSSIAIIWIIVAGGILAFGGKTGDFYWWFLSILIATYFVITFLWVIVIVISSL